MKKQIRRSMGLLAVPFTFLLATSQLSASETPEFLAEEFWFDAQGTLVDVVTPFEFQSIELRVRKRGETEVWTETVGPGVSLSVDLAHVVQSGLTDDRYTYELRFVTGQKTGVTTDAEAESSEEPTSFSTAGSFRVEKGSITDLTVPGYHPQGSGKGNTIQSDSDLEASSGGAMPMDVVDAGELAIGGWGVFGSSDTNDIVDGKLRILASPTGIASVSVQSQATNDDDYAWHFGVEDGGDFGLQRQRTVSGAKTTVLGIEADAAANSLMIASNGNIGVGTATPTDDLHIFGGDMTITDGTPTILLDNTTGSTASYYLEESNDDFRIRQTNGTGAGSHFVIEEGGNIGMGTTTPSSPVHVRRANNTAQVLVEETASNTVQELFYLKNNGHPKFLLQNTNLGFEWEFRTSVSGGNDVFAVNRLGSGTSEFFIENGGDATFAGNVTANGVLLTSTREAKTDFEPIDEQEVLNKLASLEISQWRYKSESNETRHIGPVAEEFYEVFGLSDGRTLNMIDTNGITFAAIKALKNENDALRERLTRLEAALE